VVRKDLAPLLESDQVVALPTETVYGLAARADRPEALERLRALKGRDPELPLTWHVGSRDVLGSGAELPNTVGRLANRY
jgi:L-threonylcarbamoyladenylate synthase